MAVGRSFIAKVWLAKEDIVGAPIALVLSSVAAALPLGPDITNCRLLAAEAAVKLLNFSPDIVTASPAAKFPVTCI